MTGRCMPGRCSGSRRRSPPPSLPSVSQCSTHLPPRPPLSPPPLPPAQETLLPSFAAARLNSSGPRAASVLQLDERLADGAASMQCEGLAHQGRQDVYALTRSLLGPLRLWDAAARRSLGVPPPDWQEVR